MALLLRLFNVSRFGQHPHMWISVRDHDWAKVLSRVFSACAALFEMAPLAPLVLTATCHRGAFLAGRHFASAASLISSSGFVYDGARPKDSWPS